ncbi:MAG: N-formylglutamate amidohydrolase [Geminicoccaceae bacterium]
MTAELGSPIAILQPKRASVPVILSSPHSGQIYPPCLLREVRLHHHQLRRLEDAFVDRLFDQAPSLGAPFLHARFARAFVDANREAFELDADLFDEPLPAYANPNSAKAKAGLGTIPSRIAGQAIYRSKLTLDDAERRIKLAYWPYHHALQRLIDERRTRFGQILLLDCHSMPSFSVNGALAGGPRGSGMIDFALGDRFGSSCAPAIIRHVETFLAGKGFRVARNRPYAGGYITAHYGQPKIGIHALQIEVRRGLFMDERNQHPLSALLEIKTMIQELLTWVVALMSDVAQPAQRMAVPAIEET